MLNLPPKRLRGTTWYYYDVAPENYKEVIVLLHGGGVRPEVMFEHVIGLTKNFRVVTPNLPEQLNEIEDYVAGLTLIMRHEQVKKIHLIGFGFGAVIAHHFLYLHPGRVRTCTLVHAVCPDEKKVAKFEKALRKGDFSKPYLLRLLSGYLVKQKDIHEQVVEISSQEAGEWVHVLKKFVAPKSALQARVETILDLHNKYYYEPTDFTDWKGRMLIIESEDDPLFDRNELDALQNLHPNAFIHFFNGTGYMLPLVKPSLILPQISKFINQDLSDLANISSHTPTPRNSDMTEEDAKASFEDDDDTSADSDHPSSSSDREDGAEKESN